MLFVVRMKTLGEYEYCNDLFHKSRQLKGRCFRSKVSVLLRTRKCKLEGQITTMHSESELPIGKNSVGNVWDVRAGKKMHSLIGHSSWIRY